MNYIFVFLILFSIIASFFYHSTEAMTSAMLDACNTAVKISFSLIGIMTFWLGIMRVAEKSGIVKIIANILLPVTKVLFKDIKKDSQTPGNIAMSVSANALGLANAATPIGIRVMQELQEINPDKEKATDAMCMFLAMNTAGFQIIPATVIAILVGVGDKNPSNIILPTFIVTLLSFICAILVAKAFEFIWRKYE